MPQSNGSNESVTTAAGEVLESFRSEIDAMPDSDIVAARVEIAASAATAIGSMPEIEAHRAAIVSVFGPSGGETLDRLVPIARALLAAHAAHLAVADRDLEPMAQELMEVRTRLFIAASALIQRKVVHKKSFVSLTGGQSYQARVTDTMVLVAWFRGNAATIAPHTKVDEAELAAAEEKADAFLFAYSQRDQAQAGTSQSARDRARAFTLFFNTYESVRQMLTYLRWHEGDIQQIAPSLFTRGPRKQAEDDDVTPPGSDIAPPPNGRPVSPGLPGSDPFSPA